MVVAGWGRLSTNVRGTGDLRVLYTRVTSPETCARSWPYSKPEYLVCTVPYSGYGICSVSIILLNQKLITNQFDSDKKIYSIG